MNRTKIEWAEVTWNPVTGCTPVSPGCEHCYAKRMATRLRGRFGYPADDPFRVTLHPDRLNEPLRWQKPRQVFVNSMGDLFHPYVPDKFLDRVFAVMAKATCATFLILTKRPGRMQKYLAASERRGEIARWFSTGACYRAQVVAENFESRIQWPLPNVWLGVTAENQQAADERIPILLQTPAAVRFVSCEPLLGDVDLASPYTSDLFNKCADEEVATGRLEPEEVHEESLPGIHWVICGGETGPNARPMHPDWARSLKDQCQAAGVPFFLKSMHVGDRIVKMPELDGKQWGEVPLGSVGEEKR